MFPIVRDVIPARAVATEITGFPATPSGFVMLTLAPAVKERDAHVADRCWLQLETQL